MGITLKGSSRALDSSNQYIIYFQEVGIQITLRESCQKIHLLLNSTSKLIKRGYGDYLERSLLLAAINLSR